MTRRSLLILPLMIAMLTLLGLRNGAAQDMAHINQEEVLNSMPERQRAQKKLQDFQKELQKEIRSMREEAQAKMTELQEKEGELTETKKEMMQDDISSLQQRIQKKTRKSQERIQKAREELLQPIKEKIDKAVEKVAEEEGYTYVLYERSLPYSGGEDLTEKVKEELASQRRSSSEGEESGQ